VLAKVRKTANDVLIVTVPPGKWAASDAAEAVAATEACMQAGATYVFVGDVSVMTDYEPEARQMWLALFSKRRRQFRSFWMVGRSIPPIIRMGVAAISLVLRTKFHFVATLDAVPALAGYAVPKRASH